MRVSLTLILVFLLTGVRSMAAESLLVFFPTSVRPQILQRKIASLDSTVKVIAFGRFADFQEAVASNPPDAVLSLPEVIKSMEGYTLRIGGRKNGEKSEPYLILSLDQGVDLAGIHKVTIGVADFLGRKGMKTFISEMFQPPPSIKTVAKIEDLLPLLTFKMADGILVTESQVAYFQSVSNLPFVKTPVPHAKAGTISLAVRSGRETPHIVRTVKTMDDELKKMMGDVQWNQP